MAPLDPLADKHLIFVIFETAEAAQYNAVARDEHLEWQEVHFYPLPWNGNKAFPIKNHKQKAQYPFSFWW